MAVNNLFVRPFKKWRSFVIRQYMREHGYERAVCFSCGNASRELKGAGVDVLDISKGGDLTANRWFTRGEIAQVFNGYFDATSGHLPADCMTAVADYYKKVVGEMPAEIWLPTGSGETLVALKMAFPSLRVHAVYNMDHATQYDEGAPLNKLVEALAEDISK